MCDTNTTMMMKAKDDGGEKNRWRAIIKATSAADDAPASYNCCPGEFNVQSKTAGEQRVKQLVDNDLEFISKNITSNELYIWLVT